MANAFTRHIPNTATCFNLFSGCVACVMAFEKSYQLALLFIIISALFDFADGLLARLLNAPSPIGKELDSLADMISFGMAPSLLVFSLFKEIHYPSFLEALSGYIPYAAFLIAVFSGLRLAKFNTDERQTDSFIGMPTPANALFWSSLIAGGHGFLTSASFNALYLVLAVVFFSWLLVAEVPMFSLKFKNLSWRKNKLQYIFMAGCVILLVSLRTGGLAACIVWYLLLSLFAQKKG